MNSWLEDIRYALRMLRNNWKLSAVIVASLAIGVGANSAVFSVVDALLLRPLPYPQPERLVNIWLHSPGIGIFRDWPSPGQYIDVQSENHSFDAMAIARSRTGTLTGRERPERVSMMLGQSALLRMLGAKPALGRLFTEDEDKPGKEQTGILTDRVWKRLFGSDPAIIGKSIAINGNPVAVAGVLQPDFMLTSEVMPSEMPMDKIDVFLPLPLDAKAAQNRGDEDYNIVARLKPGVTLQKAQADVDVIAARIREKDKRNNTFGMHVTSLQDQVVGDVRRALLVIFGSVGLVLLIACANVANLLLTRAAAREKEVAIRAALGVSLPRLVRQLLTESVLLSVLGGIAGLVVAQASLYVVHAVNPGNIPRLEDIALNKTVLVFTFAISLAIGILFGLAPVWRAIHVDLITSLKSGGRSARSDSGLGLGRHRLRGLLVVSELALSLVLLAGAGLLIRSFLRLQAVPPGFNADHVLTMQVAAVGVKFRNNVQATDDFYQAVNGRIARLPGVAAVGETSVLPLTGSVGWGNVNIEGVQQPPGQELQVDIREAGVDYFRAMAIPLISGRFFSEFDSRDFQPVLKGAPRPADKQPVAIVDQRFAQRFWPQGDAVGKHLWFDPKEKIQIVGVVGAVKQDGLETDGKIAFYLAQRQVPSSTMFLVARTTSDPAQLTGAFVREIRAVDPDVAVFGIQTMQDRLYESIARQRFASVMLGAFAAFALLLASVGIYGVMSYLVTQSTHDIGVRAALGARPSDILGLVLKQGIGLVAIGAVAGLGGAIALTRFLDSLLFGVGSNDALTFTAVILLLATVAVAATAIPARRAASVNPVVALREE
jgi:predicted permease